MGRKLGLDRVLDCFSLSQLCTSACACVRSVEEDDDEEEERRALVSRQLQELKDFVDGAARTLAFHLEPKTVELKVSMHCYGCAKKVQKHIAKMDGVTSFEVDLEKKKVVVVGDVTPYEVLASVSKVMKFAELLVAPSDANVNAKQQQQPATPMMQLANCQGSSRSADQPLCPCFDAVVLGWKLGARGLRNGLTQPEQIRPTLGSS